ncbi:unnamed protein product, partial [marine sediment metagenome]
LGIFIILYIANLWIDPTAPTFLRVLQDGHVWTTQDAGATWDDWGTTEYLVTQHTALWENPHRLYLARDSSAPPPGNWRSQHVIFASD